MTLDSFPLPTSSGGAFPPRDGFLIKCPTYFNTILTRQHEAFLKTLTLEVVVSSVGPTLLTGEGERVFDNKFRGENAKRAKPGTGTGLHFAKLVCDLHDIRISAESNGDPLFGLNEVPYSNFKVKVVIPFPTSGRRDDLT